MKAVLSRLGGIGIVIDDESVRMFKYGSPDLQEVNLVHACMQFRWGLEREQVFEVNDPSEAMSILSVLRHQADAKDCVMSALETDLDEDFRQEVTKRVEVLLQEDIVHKHIEEIFMCLHPLGAATYDKAINTALHVGAAKFADILQNNRQ